MKFFKLIKDKQFRQHFLFHEKKQFINKYLMYSNILAWNRKYSIGFSYFSIAKKASLTLIRNRCIFTSRARGILSRFKVSRLEFRRLAARGKLSCIRKF